MLRDDALLGLWSHGKAEPPMRPVLGSTKVLTFARVVERAAYEAAIKACDERKGRTTWVQSWADHNAGCEGCAESIRALMQEQPI